MKKLIKIIVIIFIVFFILLGWLVAYWFLRGNQSQVAQELNIEYWAAVSDDMHNSNTDMIYWNDMFYLIYATSPFHFASTDCKLVLRRSEDARNWQEITTFKIPEQDIRDPKFAPIDGKLFIYVLKNRDFTAEPYTTAYTYSEDGEVWADIEDIPELAEWLFWRPKSYDNETWYVPAYYYEHGKSILLKSTDGINWDKVSQIYEGDRNDETAIEFIPGTGRMVSTARLEVSDKLTGDENASTLIKFADPPYDTWSENHYSKVTRLDGPCLFEHNGNIYAVGRRNPDSPGFMNDFGSIFGTKRTSLFLINEDELIFLSDLPSAGDTTYAGIVKRDDTIYISYYTSDIEHDYPWIIGMLKRSDIMMATLSLSTLDEFAIDMRKQ